MPLTSQNLNRRSILIIRPDNGVTMAYESGLIRLHGERITVVSSELTRRGEPKMDGTPSKIDYARIRYEWAGNLHNDTVTFDNALYVHERVNRLGPSDFLVDVCDGRLGPNPVLKPVEPRKGCNVTARIASIVPPKGGYVPMSLVKETVTDGGVITVPPTFRSDVVGQCVQYYATFLYTGDASKATEVSRMGLVRMTEQQREDYLDLCNRLRTEGDERRRIGIMYAISSYDELFRSGRFPHGPADPDISDDAADILLEASKRTVAFMARHPVTDIEVCFPGAYTDCICKGDADVLCTDGLWDIKVSKYPPTRDNLLQVLVYHLMGMHSNERSRYEGVEGIGIYNPLLGREYTVDLSSISGEVLDEVRTKVIGYLED